jgi:hypothetical protein
MRFVRPGAQPAPDASTAFRAHDEPSWEACAQTLNLHSVIATAASYAICSLQAVASLSAAKALGELNEVSSLKADLRR